MKPQRWLPFHAVAGSHAAEIGQQAPGRIGAWVGWQIVRAYMQENPAVTLAQLLAEEDAQKILNGSKYKPRKR